MNYTIGQFAEHTGLSAYTLRYYEKLALLTPSRTANGRRFYTEKDASWLGFIIRLKETGMPLKEIQRYAILRAQGDATLTERKAMLEAHRLEIINHIDAWQHHLHNLNEKLDYYQDMITHVSPKLKAL